MKTKRNDWLDYTFGSLTKGNYAFQSDGRVYRVLRNNWLDSKKWRHIRPAERSVIDEFFTFHSS